MPKLKISMPEYNGLSSITMARETKIFSSIVYRFISAQHLKKRFKLKNKKSMKNKKWN
jgi:hypothetical protein